MPCKAPLIEDTALHRVLAGSVLAVLVIEHYRNLTNI